MRALRVHEAATDEAAEAAAWYEKERPGLGAEFEHAVDAALDLLEEEIVPLLSMPGAAGRRGVKRLILRRFPYSVIVHDRDEEILVIRAPLRRDRPGAHDLEPARLGPAHRHVPRGRSGRPPPRHPGTQA